MITAGFHSPFALGRAAAARPPLLAADPRLELKSDKLTLRTDRPEEDARITITSLEQTRSVYLRALAWGGRAAAGAGPAVQRRRGRRPRPSCTSFPRRSCSDLSRQSEHGEQLVVFSGDDAPERASRCSSTSSRTRWRLSSCARSRPGSLRARLLSREHPPRIRRRAATSSARSTTGAVAWIAQHADAGLADRRRPRRDRARGKRRRAL